MKIARAITKKEHEWQVRGNTQKFIKVTSSIECGIHKHKKQEIKVIWLHT